MVALITTRAHLLGAGIGTGTRLGGLRRRFTQFGVGLGMWVEVIINALRSIASGMSFTAGVVISMTRPTVRSTLVVEVVTCMTIATSRVDIAEFAIRAAKNYQLKKSPFSIEKIGNGLSFKSQNG